MQENNLKDYTLHQLPCFALEITSGYTNNVVVSLWRLGNGKSQVYDWHKSFHDRRDSFDDDQHSGSHQLQ
jgi:hypothetical protein